MRYKNYTWNYNPKYLKIVNSRDITSKKNVSGDNVIFDSGTDCRIISGQGELFGDDCLEQYEELLRLFNRGGLGMLYVPDIRPCYCHFAKLEMETSDKEDVVLYSFVFIEDAQKQYRFDISPTEYVAKEDETLWDVALATGIAIETLLAKNPEIKNPNYDLEQRKVRLK
jgi:hypothetical protein